MYVCVLVCSAVYVLLTEATDDRHSTSVQSSQSVRRHLPIPCTCHSNSRTHTSTDCRVNKNDFDLLLSLDSGGQQWCDG